MTCSRLAEVSYQQGFDRVKGWVDKWIEKERDKLLEKSITRDIKRDKLLEK